MSASSDLEQKLGYAFRDRDLLDRALTHASVQQLDYDYERLEFLGDRVLGLAVAEMLYSTHRDEAEGALAKRLNGLVQQRALLQVAEQWGLAALIRTAGTTAQNAVLADAVEAVIGAIHADGGFAAASAVVETFWRGLLESDLLPPEDPKMKLQEWAQAKGLPLPEYKIVSRTGSDHAPLFVVEAAVKGQAPVRAEGGNKRAAEKEAAAKLIAAIEGKNI